MLRQHLPHRVKGDDGSIAGLTDQHAQRQVQCGGGSRLHDRRASPRMPVDQHDRRRHLHADIPRPGGVIDPGEHLHAGLLDRLHQKIHRFGNGAALLCST